MPTFNLIKRTAITSMFVGFSLGLFTIGSAQTVTKLSVLPASVVGGVSSTGIVTLSQKAGTNGVVVPLNSANSAASTEPSVTVPAGKTSVTFPITTVPVVVNTVSVITVTVGTKSLSTNLTVKAPTLSSLTVSPSKLIGGATSTGSVKISSAAPAGGMPVKLACNQASVSVPAEIVVPEGATSATFAIATDPVSIQASSKITASISSSSIGVTLTVQPVVVTDVTLKPNSVIGGNPSLGTVTISGPAGSAGFNVSITSSSGSATVPSTVSVSSGATTTTFTVNTKVVGSQVSAKITAKLGASSASSSLAISTSSTTINKQFLQGKWTLNVSQRRYPPQSMTFTGLDIATVWQDGSIEADGVLSFAADWSTVSLGKLLGNGKAQLLGTWTLTAQDHNHLTFGGGGGYLWNGQFTRG